MRGLIPLDISKRSVANLIEMGIPKPIAYRIFEQKALWILTMHPDDIFKVVLFFHFVCFSFYDSLHALLQLHRRFITPISEANTHRMGWIMSKFKLCGTVFKA